MIIDYGMQPNCSELVIRLDNYNIDEVRASLSKIGIDEVYVKNYYGRWKNEQADWDDEIKEAEIILAKDVPAKIKKLFKILDTSADEKEYKEAQEKLKEAGWDRWDTGRILQDPENKLPDMEHGGSIWLCDDWTDWNGEKSVAIVGHQHCQHQIFPTLKKISDYFDSEVHPHDGGSIESYNSWLDGNLDVDL